MSPPSPRGATADFCERLQRSQLVLPVLGVLLSGCLSAHSGFDTTGAGAGVAEFGFEQHEVVLGTAERQTVVTGFLLGGDMADLAVVHIDEQRARRLVIHAFSEGTWSPTLHATLRSEVSFVDVANIGGHDRLITYAPGRLSWFDPESETERLLLAVLSDFAPPAGGEVSGEVFHVDVTRDVNGDGLDDLVVPWAHGFWVSTQTRQGAFGEPVKIGPSSGLPRVYGADGYRYDPWATGRVHALDFDLDGRRDLVFWNEDHFEVHRQDAAGRFATTAESFTTDVAFDSDQLASLAGPIETRGRRKDSGLSGSMSGSVLHSVTDMNGDGVADLVIFALKGGKRGLFGDTSALWNMHSYCEVHFGVPGPEGSTTFSPDIGALIDSDGIPFGFELHDFDLDGQVDAVFTLIDPGILKSAGMLLSSLLTNTVKVDVEFYRMADGAYPEQPNATRRPKSTTAEASGKKTFFPAVLFGDVNGDGLADLLVGQSREELRVYAGVATSDLFAPRALEVAVATPSDEEFTWLVDLDRDGRQDVVMHHGSTDDEPTQPQRVTLLIGREP